MSRDAYDLSGHRALITGGAGGMIENRWGRTVNFSSIAGQRHVDGEGVYGAVKAGVEMLIDGGVSARLPKVR